MKRDHNNNSKSSVIPLVDAIRENYRRNSEDSTNTPSSRNKFYVSHTSPIDRQQTFRQHINPSSLAQNFFLNFTIPYNRRMSENYLTRTRPHMLLLLLLLADAFLGKEEIKYSGRNAVKKKRYAFFKVDCEAACNRPVFGRQRTTLVPPSELTSSNSVTASFGVTPSTSCATT